MASVNGSDTTGCQDLDSPVLDGPAVTTSESIVFAVAVQRQSSRLKMANLQNLSPARSGGLGRERGRFMTGL